MMDSERCPRFDAGGCRCLRRLEHRGPCDFPYTTWDEVLQRRAERRLQAIRDGALKSQRGER
jgi:hypothetical protein